MTINSTTRKAGPFVGTGTVSAFPFGFKVFQASDLFVVRLNVSAAVEQTLVLNSDYSVTLNPDQNSNPGGVVTLLTGALASGYTLTLTSDVPDTQPTDLTNQGGFYPEVINDALDRATIQIQQLQEETDRTITAPISTPAGTNLTFPLPDANKFIGWNSTATGLQNLDGSTLASIVAFATAYADTFNGDGVTSTFALSYPPATVRNLDVSINGVTQVPVIDYNINGQALNFTTPPPLGSVVLAKYWQALPNSSGAAQDFTLNPNGYTTAVDVQEGFDDLGSSAGTSKVGFLQAGAGAQARATQAKLRDIVSVKDFGAVGDGVADDTVAIQAALDSAADVFLPDGTYLISDSLYMSSNGQIFDGAGVITMDAGLGKPALYIGAVDSAGTPVAAAIVSPKVRNIRFVGTGTKTLGSAGVCFVWATTTTLDSIYAWGWYAGITVSGLSIINTIINPDLRYNHIGLYDPSTNPAVSDLQASQVFGGRIEANIAEGVYLGSPNVKFIGTCIEGNGQVANGGTGFTPEVTIAGGSTGGHVSFIDCYMEVAAANTGDAVIQIASGSISRYVSIIGGEYYASNASTRYIIKSLSTSTTQAFTITGGLFTGFLNWVSATISGNSSVFVSPTFSTEFPLLSDSVTATGGAALWQWDRAYGVRTNQPVNSTDPNGLQAVKMTFTAAAAANAIVMGIGSLLQLGGSGRTIWSDGTNINIGTSGVNVVLGGGQSNTTVGQLRLGPTGPQIFQGTGVPNFAAGKGSLFLRTDGGAGSTLYVNETGGTTWAAK